MTIVTSPINEIGIFTTPNFSNRMITRNKCYMIYDHCLDRRMYINLRSSKHMLIIHSCVANINYFCYGGSYPKRQTYELFKLMCR